MVSWMYSIFSNEDWSFCFFFHFARSIRSPCLPFFFLQKKKFLIFELMFELTNVTLCTTSIWGWKYIVSFLAHHFMISNSFFVFWEKIDCFGPKIYIFLLFSTLRSFFPTRTAKYIIFDFLLSLGRSCNVNFTFECKYFGSGMRFDWVSFFKFGQSCNFSVYLRIFLFWTIFSFTSWRSTVSTFCFEQRL